MDVSHRAFGRVPDPIALRNARIHTYCSSDVDRVRPPDWFDERVYAQRMI
ncbi:MAG: hypothetical protein ACJAZO_003030 [Myxococcota bacterium]|jgi:hypothetical protein